MCFPRLHSVSLRLPSALHTAEPLWRSQCGDTVAWQRFEPPSPPHPPSPPLPAPSLFRCSVQRCSSGLRGKFLLAVPLTTGNQPIGTVLAPLTERHVHALHFLTKICHSNPPDARNCEGRLSFFLGGGISFPPPLHLWLFFSLIFDDKHLFSLCAPLISSDMTT